MKNQTIQRVLSVAGLVAVIYCGGLASSRAAVAVTWSGGSGAPLSVTFTDSVKFLVINPPSVVSGAPYFVMAGVGNIFAGAHPIATGLTFSVNGGSDVVIDHWGSGIAANDVLATDTYFHGISLGLAIGDVVTLRAGTLTGANNYAGTAPASGSINMFIGDGEGHNLGVGTAVPEVSSALFGCLGMMGLLRRRR